MESLKNHLKATKKNEVLGLVYSKITFVPLLILIVYFVTGFIVILIFFLLLVLFLYLTTFRIWRHHLNKRFREANSFNIILESKTENLKSNFQVLYRIELPKEVYWIDFKIDPNSFEISTITHTTGSNSSSNIAVVQTNWNGLLKLDKSAIVEYKKVGWEAEENLELSLQLIQRWFSEIWTHQMILKSEQPSVLKTETDIMT